MFEYLKEDMKRYHRGRMGFRKALQFLIDLRTQPVVLYRLSNFFYRNRMGVIGRFFQFLNLLVYGCWISMKTEIGPGLIIRHGFGIAIGCEKIGRYFTVFPHVFIGTKTGEPGDLEEQDVPVIGNNVTIYIGSKVFGKIHVGDNAVIGASSLVLKDVPAGTVVAGIPARVIEQKSRKEG
jgi:serine O-acetyltransferase